MDGNKKAKAYIKKIKEVKIRPLMDGNMIAINQKSKNGVKIRPLMDGN